MYLKIKFQIELQIKGDEEGSEVLEEQFLYLLLSRWEKCGRDLVLNSHIIMSDQKNAECFFFRYPKEVKNLVTVYVQCTLYRGYTMQNN